MLHNKTGQTLQKAVNGFLSGMMVFEFFPVNLYQLLGQISDRYGKTFTVMLVLCAAGYFLIGSIPLLVSCVLLVFPRGALGTLFSVAALSLYPAGIYSLTRNQTWRGMGAVLGPLFNRAADGRNNP